MKQDIVEVIEKDHKKLKTLYKKGLKKDTSFEDKQEIFEQLVLLVTAHSKSEEAVVYAPTCGDPLTKHEAFEGFEEHGLVELLIEEMKSEENDDRWEAKFMVVCELLDHHVDEEEKEYLPKLKKLFDDRAREEMAAEYLEMFARLMEAQKSISEPRDEAHLRSH